MGLMRFLVRQPFFVLVAQKFVAQFIKIMRMVTMNRKCDKIVTLLK